jgi:hypothetical protein
MPRYNIYYRQFSIIARDYVPHIQVVETDDIYHVIGKLICTSLEKIENIRYSQPRATQEECEALWREHGYRKYSGNLWSLEDPKNKDVEFEQPTEPIPIEPKKLAEMLCNAVRQMTEDEGHCDCWVQGVIDASDDEYQYIYNYLPKDAETD